MKTPRDLASDTLASEVEHTRRAAALRRLASGVQAQTTGVLGLSDKERKALTEAHTLLVKMADVSKQAAVLAKKRNVERAAREKQVRAAMKANFARMSSVVDLVALIDAVNNQVLTAATPAASKLQRLRTEFDEAIDALARSLARQNSDKLPETLVAEAWAKFERAKTAAQSKYGALIDAMTS